VAVAVTGDDAGAAPLHGRVRTFEAQRPRLLGLAYRMLGSVADAEDVVSEAWLRFAAAPDDVRSPAAWLTTVTSRLAIDELRRQQRRREDYVGPWLPEPVRTAAAGPAVPAVAPDPAVAVELAESLTLGFLVVLDTLGPLERAVFLLTDVFGTPSADVARATGRSPEAVRQLASRARRKVRDARARAGPADEELLAELVGALVAGDATRVVDLLSPEVVLTSDGGALRRAARRPVVGPERVARLLVNLTARTPAGADVAIAAVNAAPALVVRGRDLDLVLSAERDATGRVCAVRLVLNPEKLAGLDDPPALL
jgi:RNA polymerase sigma-70 factor (ECF subfamily)